MRTRETIASRLAASPVTPLDPVKMMARGTMTLATAAQEYGYSRSPSDDVALLDVVTRHPHPAARLRQPPPRRGEGFFLFGLAHDYPWSVSTAMAMQGDVAAGAESPWTRAFLIESTSGSDGDSGGALWDADGYATGIVVANDERGRMVIEPISTLRTVH